MEYYRISFFSEYYRREFWIEIDEKNEQKISRKLTEFSGTRNHIEINDLNIDLIDNDISAFLIRALEHGKVSFYNTSVWHILYDSDPNRLIKKYDLGRMLVKSFEQDHDNKLSTLSVILNYGHDIVNITNQSNNV